MGSPRSLEESAVGTFLYVEDVDARFQQAVDAGAKVTRPVHDEFMATDAELWRIPPDMFGPSRLTKKMSRRRDLETSEAS